MTSDKPTVLIVDDRPENLFVLEKLLASMDVDIVSATSGNEALAIILEHQVAVVLLDVQMPEMDGFETAMLMRGNSDSRDIPIIFVTAISLDDQFVSKGYESGAVDYLFKPLNPFVLKAKVRVFLDLFEKRTQLEDLNRALQEANAQILKQQASVVRQERLKALLQLAGATAHELNQPLMALQGNIDLLTMGSDEAQAMRYIERIQTAGQRIATIVRKIQALRHDTVKPYGEEDSIIDIDQPRQCLWVSAAPIDLAMTPATIGSDQPLLWHATRGLTADIDATRYSVVVVGSDIDETAFGQWLDSGGGMSAAVVVRLVHAPDAPVTIETVAGQRGRWILRAHHHRDALLQAIELGMTVRGGGGSADAHRNRSPQPEDLLRVMGERVPMEVIRELYRGMKTTGDRFTVARIQLMTTENSGGRAVRDASMVEAALCLREHIRDGDQAFRIGEDSFIAALVGVDALTAKDICRRYLTALTQQTTPAGAPLMVVGHCGIADAHAARSASAVWISAETALADARRQPTGTIVDADILPRFRQ